MYSTITCRSRVGGVLQQLSTAEVDQLHLQGLGVDENVLQFDVTVKNSALTAVTSSLNHLPHDVSGHRFRQSTVLLDELTQVHAGTGSLHDQGEAVGHLEPFQ